jgi:hypothetical protein
MGAFYTKCKIENVSDRSKSVILSRILVDTGREYTWAPVKSLEKIGIDREKKDVLFNRQSQRGSRLGRWARPSSLAHS